MQHGNCKTTHWLAASPKKHHLFTIQQMMQNHAVVADTIKFIMAKTNEKTLNLARMP